MLRSVLYREHKSDWKLGILSTLLTPGVLREKVKMFSMDGSKDGNPNFKTNKVATFITLFFLPY